jgi:hypothetical protein
MFEMGLCDPFGYFKHKLWPKERSGIKLSIWLLTTKTRESPWFTSVQVACHISLQSSQRGLQFFFRPHLNRRFANKVMGPQSCKSPNFGNFGLPFGSPETKCHLGVGFMERHGVYYKGEGGGFPQVRAVVSLVNPNLPVACLSTKSAQTMH